MKTPPTEWYGSGEYRQLILEILQTNRNWNIYQYINLFIKMHITALYDIV